ncbi:Aldose 1-epimerase [Dichanthelium oligosanthes]|uniref:Aldose 1-epimerase n=1 Tax=Dichanthelium oligosanthes TaxID=888268 RepID=A0A1E5UUB0_9POAL|nr:Aldose 1-epimerase [Dichanthelium oligosanthes]
MAMARGALHLRRLPVLALCLVVGVCLLCGGRNAAAAERKVVGVHELKRGDFSIKVTNWGATLMSVILPDSKGNLDDVVLGYDTVAEYVNGTAYFGGLIGRVANRIAGARFTLDGKAYRLYRNDGNNSLHGGHHGFSKVIWTVKERIGGDSPYITLYYHSFDGEQGFPGDLDVYVTYQLSPPHVLSVRMNATARGNKATPVNLAHHAYWNLGGHGSGPILGETVQILASRYTPVDAALIPTGALAPVAGTPYDFRAPAPVGSDARLGELLRRGVAGYDTNYAVDGATTDGSLRPVAHVRDGATGRAMELWADQPGVQLYTANGLRGVRGKGSSVYERYGALCLETQGFPDAVNHPSFPSQIVRPGQVYRHDMVFTFSF